MAVDELTCRTCNGYGLWKWLWDKEGQKVPMNEEQAQAGYVTIRCPECGRSANPLEGE